MARPKKNGRRATGIQGKSGYLYIITHKHIIKDGVKTREKVWIATWLKDTPENIKKASEMKNKLLNNKREISTTDRNVILTIIQICSWVKRRGRFRKRPTLHISIELKE